MLMLLFQLKGLVLGKGTLLSLWKLPSCSIGMDISNPGEEQLPMQKSGRSGMSLTLQASSTWSADTWKPMKQSRVHLNTWWCFLRKLLEPSRTFSFQPTCITELTLPSGAQGDTLIQVQFWKAWVQRRLVSPVWHKMLLQQHYRKQGKISTNEHFCLCHFSCVLLLLTTSLLAGIILPITETKFLRTKYKFSWCLHQQILHSNAL